VWGGVAVEIELGVGDGQDEGAEVCVEDSRVTQIRRMLPGISPESVHPYGDWCTTELL
jgi:hypothetical protein